MSSGVTTVTSTDRPELWHDLLGLSPQYSFGWNIPARHATSLGTAIMLRCAAVKARDIAKGGMYLWRTPDQDKWEKVAPAQHWLAKKLARRPNDLQSWGEFWRMLIMHLSIMQRAHILPRFNRVGEVVEFIPILPGRIRRRTGRDGRLFWEIDTATDVERIMLRRDQLIVAEERVITIVGTSWDGFEGLSNLALAAPIVEVLDSVRDYQASLFGNNGKLPVAFETDATFDGAEGEVAFNRLKRQLRQSFRDMQTRGDPLLLDAGLTAKVLANSSRENTTTDSFQQLAVQICSQMEVPPHKLFLLDTVKYDNAAHLDNQYISDILYPMADNIEEKLRLGVLTDDELDEYWPEFDREMMAAQDPKSINERVKVGMGTGVMMQNEGRQRIGLNPVEKGNFFTVPVNTAIMREDGTIEQMAADGQNNNDGTTDTGDGNGSDGPRLVVNND
jgi:HK97 family phage portal protein